jgi:putative hydrolase of the HAD superfamily
MKEYGDEAFSEGFDKKKLKAMQISRIQRALQDYNIQITEEQAIQFQLDFEDYQNEIQLFPKMEELLDLLVNEQQIIGIITNGTIKKQSKKITMLNLDKWFPQNRMFISEKVGISKPEKFIFEQFEKKLDYQNDIVGPKSVGWHTIWVNYRGYREEKESLSDYIVHSPDELLSVVQRLVYK